MGFHITTQLSFYTVHENIHKALLEFTLQNISSIHEFHLTKKHCLEMEILLSSQTIYKTLFRKFTSFVNLIFFRTNTALIYVIIRKFSQPGKLFSIIKTHTFPSTLCKCMKHYIIKQFHIFSENIIVLFVIWASLPFSIYRKYNYHNPRNIFPRWKFIHDTSFLSLLFVYVFDVMLFKLYLKFHFST